MSALKVLIVDDQHINLMLMDAIVRSLGHEVVTVDSAKEGIFLLRKETFDILMMDIEMPEMNGIDAAKLIRSSGIVAPEFPIVAVTANSDDDDRAAYKAAGMQGYIQKPISPEALVDVLKQFELGE